MESFPTCSATPPPSDHLLCQPSKLPWVENSSQQRSLPVPRLDLILQLQLTPCLQPFTLVDQMDNSKRLSFKLTSVSSVVFTIGRVDVAAASICRPQPTSSLQASNLRTHWPMFIVSRVLNKLEFSPCRSPTLPYCLNSPRFSSNEAPLPCSDCGTGEGTGIRATRQQDVCGLTLP